MKELLEIDKINTELDKAEDKIEWRKELNTVFPDLYNGDTKKIKQRIIALKEQRKKAAIKIYKTYVTKTI